MSDIYEAFAESQIPSDWKHVSQKQWIFSMPASFSRRGTKWDSADTNNPLGEAMKENRLSGLAWGFRSPSTYFEKKDIVMIWLWTLLAGIVFYGYSSDVYGKIEQLPTKHKSLSVARQNISDQKKEIEYLDKLSTDSKELEIKEKTLDKYLTREDPKVALVQTNKLSQIIDDAWVQVSSFGKSSEQREDSRVGDMWKSLEGYKIGNFYENAWYNKFSMDMSASEEQIMRFMEETERVPLFVIDSFGISRSNDDIKYSLVTKSFYLLSDTTNESN